MKLLIPSTIISPALYVERAADRQLSANIRDMGRPAYVLVARQMGKTNLLIHTKRKNENEEVQLVYVDLSVSSYQNERDCFRSIIDIAIESHSGKFAHLSPTIDKIRAQMRPPNREHELELRALLNSTSSKLIIILDEIDSLVNADFSDRVFAHIRSVYFSRVNYQELERLSYILSGVVEPNEIIKDKKISPFNIGEKIYLDDFEITEVKQFISQAKLNLSQEGLARLVYWTGGNPRILWDICAQLEDLITESPSPSVIGPDMIDSVVDKYYLSNFDHAPVDHIRELVRDSPDVRSAVWNLVNGDEAGITDSLKTKLYLSGITKAVNAYEKPRIKNEIIARALSKEWLGSLTEDQVSLYSQAREYYEREKYDKALSAYETYLQISDKDDKRRGYVAYQVGMCEYYLQNYGAALNTFEKLNDLADLRPSVSLRIGMCLAYLERFDESIQKFEQASLSIKDDHIGIEVHINLASTLLKRAKEEDSVRAEKILSGLLDKLGNENNAYELKENALKKYKVTILYNLGQLHHSKDNYGAAHDCYLKALEFAELGEVPVLYMRLAKTASDSLREKEYLSHAVHHCINKNVWPATKLTLEAISFEQNHAANLLGLLTKHELTEEFQVLLNHFGKASAPDTRTIDEWLIATGRNLSLEGDKEIGVQILERALANINENKRLRLECLTWICLFKRERNVEFEYVNLLGDQSVRAEVTVLDISNIAFIAASRVIDKCWPDALSAVRSVSRFRGTIDAAAAPNYVCFDMIELMCLEKLGPKEELSHVAKRLLKLAKEVALKEKKPDHIFFSEEELEAANAYAEKVLSTQNIKFAIPRLAPQLPNKGRNEKVNVRYTNGQILQNVKFKRVEGDILKGKCKVVNLPI